MKIKVKAPVKQSAIDNAKKLAEVLNKPAVAAKMPKGHKSPAPATVTAKAAKTPKVKKPAGFTYRNNELVAKAFCYGARKLDIVEGKGLKTGQIIETTHGYNVVECDLPGMTAKVVPFKANGKVEWNKVVVPCMHLAGRNYVAAQWKTAKGTKIVNVEIDRFAGQSTKTKAVLVQ